MPADLYDVLGADDDASADALKRAYRERVREYHPDQNDHPEGDAQFKLIRTAHEVLSDPVERNTYDRLGHREYVEQHLDDLPPISVFPDEALPDDATTDAAATSADGPTGTSATGTSDPTGRTSTGTDDSGSEDGATVGSDATGGYGATGSDASAAGTSTGAGSTAGNGSAAGGSTASGGSTGTAGSSTGTATDDRSTAGNGATAAGPAGAKGAGTTAGSGRDSWDAAADSTRTATDDSVPAGVRRRRGLKRWYGVVALSLLVYLGGLGAYALPRQGALRAFVGDATASPVATLLGSFPLASPTRYVLDAAAAASAGTPTLGLVLLAGTALLPLVVLTTVGRFGRGAAWLYAVPSLAPAVCLAAWTAVSVPTWAALAGLVLLPVLSGGGFLVDVGRYLLATR